MKNVLHLVFDNLDDNYLEKYRPTAHADDEY